MVKPSLLPHVEALHADGMMSNIFSDTAAFASVQAIAALIIAETLHGTSSVLLSKKRDPP